VTASCTVGINTRDAASRGLFSPGWLYTFFLLPAPSPKSTGKDAGAIGCTVYIGPKTIVPYFEIIFSPVPPLRQCSHIVAAFIYILIFQPFNETFPGTFFFLFLSKFFLVKKETY
jgi:hypothetical protein